MIGSTRNDAFDEKFKVHESGSADKKKYRHVKRSRFKNGEAGELHGSRTGEHGGGTEWSNI